MADAIIGLETSPLVNWVGPTLPKEWILWLWISGLVPTFCCTSQISYLIPVLITFHYELCPEDEISIWDSRLSLSRLANRDFVSLWEQMHSAVALIILRLYAEPRLPLISKSALHLKTQGDLSPLAFWSPDYRDYGLNTFLLSCSARDRAIFKTSLNSIHKFLLCWIVLLRSKRLKEFESICSNHQHIHTPQLYISYKQRRLWGLPSSPSVHIIIKYDAEVF